MLGLLRRSRCLWRGRGGGGPIISYPTKTTFNYLSIPFLQVCNIGDYFTKRKIDGWRVFPEAAAKITEGDVINLNDLLFTKNRDYLVRYQDNQHVKAEHLADKVIVIYFTPQVHCDHNLEYYLPLLENLHHNLYPRNGFEVVFVPFKGVDHDHSLSKVFCKYLEEEIFSLRPWIAIPSSDIPSEESLQTRGFPTESNTNDPPVLIVDSTGMVLQSHINAYYLLELYGALGYPFTDERIKYLQSEDDAIAMQPSLQTLLASPQRDYVISNKGDRVPIHTLEDKVVALYFYEDGDDSVPKIPVSKLKIAYEELKKKDQNFEVVLIYTPGNFEFYCTSEKSFWKAFETMPWLALPFKDPNVTKLKRILEYSLANREPNMNPNHVTRLVIFGPGGEFIEPFGANILDRFGSIAYPFTCAKLVELEIEKVNDMKLEMLWDRNTVFSGKDRSEVPVSQLAGKNVIVFYRRSHDLDFYEIEFIKILKERYVQCRGTHDEFEVIHIVETREEVSKYDGYLPWLVCELLPHSGDERGGNDDFFCVHGDGRSFVFFDGDGRVVRKTIWPSIENKDFPFCADGLENEAWAQLDDLFELKPWYGSKVPCLGRPRIYSLEKMNAPATLSLREFKKGKWDY